MFESPGLEPDPNVLTYYLRVDEYNRRSIDSFSDREKEILRPIAETLAMLDGNAFFGNTFDREGKSHDWYEMYLPEAWALYKGNGGNSEGTQGWASEVSWLNAGIHIPAVKAAWDNYQLMKKLAREEK